MSDGNQDAQLAATRKELEGYHTRMSRLAAPAVEFAELLAAVKAKKLYLIDYTSWSEYIRGQWGHSQKWADPLIKSHQAVALPEPPKDDEKDDEKPGVPFGGPDKSAAAEPPPAVADPVVVALAEAKTVFGDAIRHAHLLLRKVRAIAETKHGQFLAYEELKTHVRNAVAALKHAQPVAPCPYCDQGRRLKRCKHCKGQRYVNKFLRDAAPEDLRK